MCVHQSTEHISYLNRAKSLTLHTSVWGPSVYCQTPGLKSYGQRGANMEQARMGAFRMDKGQRHLDFALEGLAGYRFWTLNTGKRVNSCYSFSKPDLISFC